MVGSGYSVHESVKTNLQDPRGHIVRRAEETPLQFYNCRAQILQATRYYQGFRV